MALTALDLGLRGAVVGLFLVVCVVLLRYTAVRLAANLGIAMGVSGAAYAISTAPFFPMSSFGWNSPIIALAMSFPVIFWLWARAIFEEDFVLRPWHAATCWRWRRSGSPCWRLRRFRKAGARPS